MAPENEGKVALLYTFERTWARNYGATTIPKGVDSQGPHGKPRRFFIEKPIVS
jgi:hypothetical protein